ncbi:hypothetical protein Y5A_020520 [Burkholderia glumae AU6208]|nr:hypothetical protein Y5A_020520 [Burkholderia glumae AU6208]
MKPKLLYHGHRFPAAIISQAVRWALSRYRSMFTPGASSTRTFHAADGFWVTSVNSRHVEKRTARCLR